MIRGIDGVKLLNRPSPKEGESLYSWLVRIGCANGFPRASWVKGLLDPFGSNERTKTVLIPTEEHYQIIERGCGVSRRALKKLSWANLLRPTASGGSSLFRSFFTKPFQQICPLCVEENGVWKKAWDLNAVACCPKHGCYLVSRCYCGVLIPTFSNSLSRCDCGRNLYGRRFTGAPEFLCEYVRFIEALKGQEQISQLLEHRFLSWYWAQVVGNLSAVPSSRWSIRKRHLATKFVARYHIDPEERLFSLMDKFASLKRSASDSSGFRVEFGDVQDSLERMVSQGYQGNISKLFDRYLLEQWNGRHWLLRRLGGDHLSQKSLQADMGIREATFSRLVKRLGLNSRISQKGSYFDKVEQDKLKKSYSEFINLTKLAKVLGVSYYLAESLVKDCVLPGVAPFKGRNQRDWEIRMLDLEALECDLVTGSSELAGDIITIRHYLKKIMKHGVTFSFIVSNIRNGNLCYKFEPGSSLLDIQVALTDIELLEPSVTKKASRLLSVNDVAKRLSISCKRVSSLVRESLLIPYKAPGHHKSNRKLVFTEREVQKYIEANDHEPALMTLSAAATLLGKDRSWLRKQVLEKEQFIAYRLAHYSNELFLAKSDVKEWRAFISKTFTGPELAKIVGVTRNTIYKWKKSGKIQAVSGPDIDGLGCYRYLMKEVSRATNLGLN
jgi:predicted DNA-binding transcriptional regulator AlpA